MGNNNTMNFDYSEIRYYNDDDFRKYIGVLADEPLMYRILNFYKPGISETEAKNFLLSFKSINDFQKNFIIHLIEKIINSSIERLTFSGVENIDLNKKHLFITNHRNIVMDVSILNYILYKSLGDNFQSTAIAIGNNLLGIPWVKHLARMNKSFLVERDLTIQEMLLSSKRLSAYIREIITSGTDSIWIANREGRTKDGNDFTQAGLIKMLTMSSEGLFSKVIGELNVIPVAISYEYDPCDQYKINEIATTRRGEKYVKGPTEDFNSMFLGLMGKKGKVHIHFGEEFTKDKLLKINENIPVNQKVRNFCDYLDRFIYSNYHLYENNYIAADLLNRKPNFEHLYSKLQYNAFVEQVNEKLSQIEGDRETNLDIMLKMFGYPVKNYYSVIQSDYKFNF